LGNVKIHCLEKVAGKTAANRMNFTDFIRACGVVPPLNLVPGKWCRCSTVAHPRKKNASAKLAESGLIGWVHDFSAMASPETWRAEKDAPLPRGLDAEELASRERQRRKELTEATNDARRYYEACKPLKNSHPYLSGKGLDMSGCYGLKIDAKGALVVPVMWRGKVISVQRIEDEGGKWFWPGATTKGGSYVIDRRGATITLLCEGLATALTVFSAVPSSRVVCAFNAGNLLHVAAGLNAAGLVAVCADNDHGTEARLGRNPGVDAANVAAESLGCGVAVPRCAGTDFNDLQAETLAALLAARQSVRGYTQSDAQLVQLARSKVASVVMGAVKFVPHREIDQIKIIQLCSDTDGFNANGQQCLVEVNGSRSIRLVSSLPQSVQDQIKW
jgi:putative DNA primase/helicase